MCSNHVSEARKIELTDVLVSSISRTQFVWTFVESRVVDNETNTSRPAFHRIRLDIATFVDFCKSPTLEKFTPSFDCIITHQLSKYHNIGLGTHATNARDQFEDTILLEDVVSYDQKTAEYMQTQKRVFNVG